MRIDPLIDVLYVHSLRLLIIRLLFVWVQIDGSGSSRVDWSQLNRLVPVSSLTSEHGH